MPRINPQIALIIILSTFVFVSFVLYNSVDSDASRREVLYKKSELEFTKLKQKIQNLGKDVEENANVVDKLEHKLNEADSLKPVEIPNNNNNFGGGKVKIVHDVLQKAATPAVTFRQLVQPPQGTRICPSHDIVYSSDSSIQMLQAYDIIPFDNVDGGVWKQGWNIEYDSKKILEEKKLEVIVVPHSHCDPGWLDTFEGYFQSQTKNILDGMLNFLPKNSDMKFIYAEMSFFELWWSTLKADERRTVKKLLDQGQFEIVTGAWVMTDEANAHYYSTVMEMLEGHEFLINQLAGNLSHAAVQRVHYSVKKFLAQKQNLEFKWRQLWAGKSDKTDIFTHMFPFYSYDVPHTCGPDPKV
uniref:Glycoside hydrolase family 38 N-terminal domain-containing protein n=1 Tax=Panagrolaimus sp. PS1159 TaxID=55785 RepID=A0AC35FQB4_9BILA